MRNDVPMAIVHRATLTPHKFDLVLAWAPTQPWYTGDGPAEIVSSFRLDDPAGQVGIETFIVRGGTALFHVPLTYRSAALPGGVPGGELEHSAMGHRWLYDGVSDPVYLATTAAAIASAGHEVEMFLPDGTTVPRADNAARVVGSGPAQATGELVVARELPPRSPTGAPDLRATWAGQDTPLVLAWLR